MRPATITIPQPCAESWAAMTPTAAGRHCAACQKTVVDFAQKTDAEILAALARAAGGSVCGRFRAGQVEWPLQSAVPARRWQLREWRRWPALALTIWLSREITAPAAPAQTPTEQQQPQRPAYLPGPADPPELHLRGIVVDSTGLEIPGATVLLLGTNTGVSADAQGRFDLPLPAALWRPDKTVVSFSMVGYKTIHLPLGSKPSPVAKPLRIVLSQDRAMLGELVIVGGASYPRPYPWHPRAFWSWLTRPFRR